MYSGFPIRRAAPEQTTRIRRIGAYGVREPSAPVTAKAPMTLATIAEGEGDFTEAEIDFLNQLVVMRSKTMVSNAMTVIMATPATVVSMAARCIRVAVVIPILVVAKSAMMVMIVQMMAVIQIVKKFLP